MTKENSYSAQMVCEMLQISKSTLFKWEREGKIRPVERDWRGWRVYRDHNIDEIRGVIAQQAQGSRRERSDTVLVVDDEPEIRQVLTEVLERGGFEVITASGGEEAIAKHAEFAPGLIFMDIKMAGMSGKEAFKEIRRMDRKVPIILLTGYPDIKDAVELVKLGALNYITKPFDIDEITRITKEILR